MHKNPVSAPIFDIQSFATHDGPGIRTVVFMKGCPLRCTWCSNPEGQISEPQIMYRCSLCRMCLGCINACNRGAAVACGDRILFNSSLCSGCPDMRCIAQCPAGALKVAGKSMTVEELTEEILRDVRFFRNSGGGVTFSGGEPFIFAGFLRSAGEKLASYGISMVAETSGYWDWSQDAVALADLCSLIYYDLKGMDGKKHGSFTGKPQDRILKNLKSLSQRCPEKIIISIPLIPGLNDTAEEIRLMGNHILGLGLQNTRLLPYHNYSIGKYEQLGLKYPHDAWDRRLEASFVDEAGKILSDMGLNCEMDS